MAYKGYMFRITNSTELFAAICAALITAGWTLHDNIDATHKVYKTQGESGKEPPGYLWLYNDTGNNRIEYQGYAYWNSTGHAGTRGAYAFGGKYVYAYSGQDCYISVDKDLIVVSSSAGSNGNHATNVMAVGFVTKVITTLTTTTDGIVAGSDVSIPVVSSEGFGVGTYCQIMGTTEGCGKLQINSIPDATHIQVATLPRNYASGAYIGLPASTFGVWRGSSSTLYPCCYPSDAGTSVGSYYYNCYNMMSGQTLAEFTGKCLLMPVSWYADGGSHVGYTGKNIMYIGVGSSGKVAIANNDLSVPVVSTATSATSTTLTDSAKSWTPDDLIGKWVVITAGVGVGQVRKITDNDGTTLTVGTWYTTPDGTSEYKICDKLWWLHHGNIAGQIMAVMITDFAVPA